MGDNTLRDSGDATTACDDSLEARMSAAGFSDEILSPGTVIQRFIVHRVLGVGATGVVYAAHDPQLDRTIALKLLRRQLADRSDARARFLREAQALARLSHPNVISVYDVGTAAGWTFIAMEYIHGQTFGEWLATSQPSWPEAVAVLIKAGGGLAAAHAEGIIHRDFKPANLLIGARGRVVVTDFGLARAAMIAADKPTHEPELASGSRDSALAQPLTRTGAVQGTPAYMAPEQREGEVADARADQYSFCVTLYEAVFGRRPSAAVATLPSDEPTARARRKEAVRRGTVATRDRRVPAWLLRAILRGLSASPEDRYPSMDGLLAALSHGTARRRRRVLAITAAAALVIAGTAITVYAVSSGAQTALCAGAEDQLAEIWNATTRAEMRSAFAATGVSYAADSWRRIEPILDGYAGQWAAMHAEACRATRIRGEQSEVLMDKRMACLDVRRRELDQLARLLRHPDAGVVEHGVGAARGLSSIQGCGDLAALTRPIKPPADAIAARVSAARQALAQVRVLVTAGRTEDARAALDKLASDPATRDYLPVRADVSLWNARLDASHSQWERARSHLDDAIWAAEASGDDEIAVRALGEAIWVLAELDRFKEGHEVVRRGEAALMRFPASAADRVEFRRHVCQLFDSEEKAQEAMPSCQEALAIARRELPPDSPGLASALTSISSVLAELGDYETSLSDAQQALALSEKIFGPDHPGLGKLVSNVGTSYARLGRWAEALPFYRRAIATEERSDGPDSPAVANTLNHMATALMSLKRYPEADATFRRAIAIMDRTLGPDHSSAASLQINFAALLEAEKDYAGAVEHMQRAVTILAATVGTASSGYATAVLNICGLEVERNRPREALAACERGMPILERALGPSHPTVAQALLAIIAPAYAANGRPRDAIAALDRGIAIWPKDDPRRDSAIADFELSVATSIWDSPPHDHAQARALATRTRARLRDADRAEADAWLASHAGK